MTKTPLTTGSPSHPGPATYVPSIQLQKTVFTLLQQAAPPATCPLHRHSAQDSAMSYPGTNAPLQLKDVSHIDR